MIRSVRFWAAVTLVCFVIVSSFFRRSNLQNVSSPEKRNEHTETAAQTISAPDPGDETLPPESAVTIVSAAGMAEPAPEEPTIAERYKRAAECCGDLVGWICLDGTEIDYPVVHGEDNRYYLSHALDGSFDRLGTIFLDRYCSADFSDPQSILYGHNMINMDSGMFAELKYLKDEKYFDEHRYGQLYTEKGLCRIDFFAVVIVSAYDELYIVPADSGEWLDRVRESSRYLRDIEIPDDPRFIALSTCSYDYKNSRLMYIGLLDETDEGDDYDPDNTS